MSEKEYTPPSPHQIKDDPHIRKTFNLYLCMYGSEHLWMLSVPKYMKDGNIYGFYNMDFSFKFNDKEQEYVNLMFICTYCKRVHVNRSSICKKCHKAIRPISSKMQHLLLTSLPIGCTCKKSTNEEPTI